MPLSTSKTYVAGIVIQDHPHPHDLQLTPFFCDMGGHLHFDLPPQTKYNLSLEEFVDYQYKRLIAAQQVGSYKVKDPTIIIVWSYDEDQYHRLTNLYSENWVYWSPNFIERMFEYGIPHWNDSEEMLLTHPCTYVREYYVKTKDQNLSRFSYP